VLTGAPPFTGANAQTILAQQLAGDFDASRFEEPLTEFLRTGLAADPARRYPDATTMRAAWHEVMDAEERRAHRTGSWWGRIVTRGE
jgi:hypothetical protein